MRRNEEGHMLRETGDALLLGKRGRGKQKTSWETRVTEI